MDKPSPKPIHHHPKNKIELPKRISCDVETQSDAVFWSIKVWFLNVDVPAVIQVSFIKTKTNFWSETQMPRITFVLISYSVCSKLNSSQDRKRMKKSTSVKLHASVENVVIISGSPNLSSSAVMTDKQIAFLNRQTDKPILIVAYSWT